ncbi:MAG: hypothetical protein Q8S33_10260 [Myxococcales bacterium]|nr:hypothetical protein [Myxococcales bacterium]MDP3500708.1 hypothetical protein [Myxococcales bacterium]
MRSALSSSLVVMAALLSCTPPVPVPVPEQDAGPTTTEDGGVLPLLELGTGTQSFERLSDGQSAQVIAGPQGGFHIWASARIRAPLDPKLIQLRVIVKSAGIELTSTDYRVTMVPNRSFFEWYAMTALVPDPAAVMGQPTTVELIATDSANRTATDSRTVIPFGP